VVLSVNLGKNHFIALESQSAEYFGYNSACIRDICEIGASSRGNFGSGY